MEAAARAQPGPDHIHELVRRYGHDAMACQILNPGIVHWHSPDGEAALGYVSAAGYRVVAGGPLCAPAQLPAVAAAFRAEARRQGERVCYFGVGEDFLATLDVRQQGRMLLGAQPVWNPAHWPQALAGRPSLRSQIRRMGPRLRVEVWDAARARASAELARCRREWLATRRLPPMGFVVETDVLAQLDGRRVYVATEADHPVAFLVALPVPGRSGWLIDQLIRGAQAPNGTMELLLDGAMTDLAALGSRWVSLGLSPLSQRAGLSYAAHPRWLRVVLALVRRLGSPLYRFDGLDAFKARLGPERWEPLYAVDADTIRLRTLYAIASAFGGTAPALFALHGLLRLAVARRS